MPSIPAKLTRLLKATPPAVAFVPGSTFFTRRLALPEELQASEIDGFVELSLEGLSPFPTDQLFFGYVTAEGGGAVFVFAAYRRRFPAEVIRSWSEQAFVLPDFLPVLRRSWDEDTTVFLEIGGDVSALAFRAGRSLPEALVSRPLPESADESVRAAHRESLKEAIGRRGLLFEKQISLAGEWAVAEDTGGLSFTLPLPPGEPVAPVAVGEEVDAVESADQTPTVDPVPPPPEPAVALSFDELWAMDIRDPDFLAGRKQAVRVDTFMWRGLLGIAALFVLLLAGELLLIGGKVSLGIVSGLTAKRQGEVERIMDRHGIVNRLAEFDRSNLIPFEMLRAINAARPRTVYFTRAATEGPSSLIIDASTKNVADVNQYEAALRATAEVLEVEVRNLKPRDDGTTFTLVVTFRAGAFESATGGVQTAAR